MRDGYKSSRRLKPVKTSGAPPKEQILGSFDRLERSFASTGFRGCPFVNAVTELGDAKHPANAIAVAFKDQRRAFFYDLLAQLGVTDPEGLSGQLAILFEGAITMALVGGNPHVARAAREAARVLLTAAGAACPLPP